MVDVNTVELTETIEELRNEIRGLSGRLAALEHAHELSQKPAVEPVQQISRHPVKAQAPEPVAEEPISEEVLLIISAAVAAFLGERAHIRQVRLLRSTLWAQQGRVSIQASHYLHHH